jgi:hypothetical protein
LGCRRLLEGLAIEGADNEAEGLGNSIDRARYGEDTLNSTSAVFTDCALRTSHLADLRNILTPFADHGGGLLAGDDGAKMKPARLILSMVWCL